MFEARTTVNGCESRAGPETGASRQKGYDPSQTKVLQKIEQELSDIWYLLDTFQAEILRQKTDLKVIKDLRNSVDETHKTAQHLVENVPSHLPKKAAPTSSATQKTEAVQPDPDKPEHTKNSTKPKQFVRGMEFLVIEEFNQIPTYMKGRMTYDQINAVIKELNDIVKAKYKILNQPLKSMNNTTRNQYHSFKEQEVKETKGQYFFVEADIKEFSNLRVDKKLHGVFNVLRHCQRMREVRGGKLVRYMLL
ncbi:spindle and kinetochore-associated protein 1 isoform X2 [Callorhinchus milii]|uniref:spindle and kinetochore-associated protein 1 isoform X2 n=1 Tax=Callorhinchus milii TaxID=7868 RepID=UPI001C3F64FF|nr:spindle and kinetochore-associated protein 1 isoform X2 [Callorhinchus milii]